MAYSDPDFGMKFRLHKHKVSIIPLDPRGKPQIKDNSYDTDHTPTTHQYQHISLHHPLKDFFFKSYL